MKSLDGLQSVDSCGFSIAALKHIDPIDTEFDGILRLYGTSSSKDDAP